MLFQTCNGFEPGAMGAVGSWPLSRWKTRSITNFLFASAYSYFAHGISSTPWRVMICFIVLQPRLLGSSLVPLPAHAKGAVQAAFLAGLYLSVLVPLRACVGGGLSRFDGCCWMPLPESESQ